MKNNSLKRVWLRDVPTLKWKAPSDTIEFYEAKGWSKPRYYCCIPNRVPWNNIFSTIQSELRTTTRVWLELFVENQSYFNIKIGIHYLKKLVKKNNYKNRLIAERWRSLEKQFYFKRNMLILETEVGSTLK